MRGVRNSSLCLSNLVFSMWVSFKANIFLLIFCLDDLSIAVNGVFMFHTMIMFLSVTPFSSVSSHLAYFGAP